MKYFQKRRVLKYLEEKWDKEYQVQILKDVPDWTEWVSIAAKICKIKKMKTLLPRRRRCLCK